MFNLFKNINYASEQLNSCLEIQENENIIKTQNHLLVFGVVT